MPLTKGNLTLTDAEVEAAVAAKNISLGEGKPGDLERVAALASSTSELERRVAEDLLAYLALDFPEARQKIEELSRSPRLNERLVAFCAARRAHPDRLKERIALRLLTDRSRKVRWNAVRYFKGARRTDLIPELEAIRDAATNEVLREQLRQTIDLLRDGYCISTDSDGGLWFNRYTLVLPPNTYGITQTPLDREEVESMGVQAAIAPIIEEDRACEADTLEGCTCGRRLDLDYWWEIGEGRRAAIHKMLRAVDDRDPGPPDRARFEARKAAAHPGPTAPTGKASNRDD